MDDAFLDGQRVQWILYGVLAADVLLYLFLFDTVRNVFEGSLSPLTVAVVGFYVVINVGATYLVLTVE